MFTKKIIIFIFFLTAHLVVHAQLGINTKTPLATLDVQGNLGIRNRIYLGGSNTVLGMLGDVGTVMVSQGPAKSPVWKMIRRPPFDPFLYTIFNNEAAETEAGLTLGNTVSGYDLNTLNQTLSSYNGTVIAGLTKTFEIDNPDNVALLSFETISHLQSNTINSGVDFSCGIFVDDQLKGVRVYTLNQPSTAQYPFYTFDMVVSATNLSVGNHEAKVACKRRANINNFTSNIGIGKAVNSNLNDFMTKSSLVVETYEKPNMTNTIPVYNP